MAELTKSSFFLTFFSFAVSFGKKNFSSSQPTEIVIAEINE